MRARCGNTRDSFAGEHPMNVRSLLAIASVAFLAACSGSDITAPRTTVQSIADSYIVTVADGLNAEQVADDHGITPHYVYTDAMNGFAAFMTDAKHTELLSDKRVTAIEADEVEVEETTENGATWGLDRI